MIVICVLIGIGMILVTVMIVRVGRGIGVQQQIVRALQRRLKLLRLIVALVNTCNTDKPDKPDKDEMDRVWNDIYVTYDKEELVESNLVRVCKELIHDVNTRMINNKDRQDIMDKLLSMCREQLKDIDKMLIQVY